MNISETAGRADEVSGLHNFLSPKAIAIVGASPHRGSIRGAILHMLTQNAFSGELYPINPSYPEIHALRCYPNVSAVGRPIDLAIVAIPATAVPAALEDCAAAGVGNVVVVSSGFAEEGGQQALLQEQITAIARRTGMRICGPNAEGFFNSISRIAATFSPATDPASESKISAVSSRIAVVAQSGGIGFSLYGRGRAQGLNFSHVITTGNECDLTIADFVHYLADNEDTAAILLYLESVRDPERFRAAAIEAARRGKPIVAIKVGRSEAGIRAARAHTASEAGWAPACDAFFTECGVTLAHDPDEALAIAAAFTTVQACAGPRVGIVTTAGGAGTLLSDSLVAAGLQVPLLQQSTQQSICSMIPSYGSAANPVDITAQAIFSGGLVQTIKCLYDGDEVDLIIVALSLSAEKRVSLDLEAFRTLVDQRRKPILIYAYTLPSSLAQRSLAEIGVIPFPSLKNLASAAAAIAMAGARQRHSQQRFAAPPPINHSERLSPADLV
jgi:acetate---CoA ligase (ADP-forming)